MHHVFPFHSILHGYQISLQRLRLDMPIHVHVHVHVLCTVNVIITLYMFMYMHVGRYSDLLSFLVLSSHPFIKSFFNNFCNLTAITFTTQLIIVCETRSVLVEWEGGVGWVGVGEKGGMVWERGWEEKERDSWAVNASWYMYAYTLLVQVDTLLRRRFNLGLLSFG